MKKIICFIFLYIISFQTYSYAAQATGNAEVLKVTMRKIELCAGYQGGDFDDILTDAFCNNPVVIGSGDKVVDIAGVNAGAAAASVGSRPRVLTKKAAADGRAASRRSAAGRRRRER